MAADPKAALIDFQKSNAKNKVCVDCGNPNPQWASVTFAVFFCLQCAGLHRGLGVHISFVRSVTMDSWQQEQVQRMLKGGNEPFTTFLETYTPADQGGYSPTLPIPAKYQCWAAKQYREKLDAAIEGKPWSQSAPPAPSATPELASSAQFASPGLRKSRATNRTGSLRDNSASPAPSLGSGGSSARLDVPADRKATNEAFFADLGAANAARPDHLPPSQGGRYAGFGNTPTPPPANASPAFNLSSHAAPSLSDFQENPVAALGKGWSLFSAAVVGATRAVNDNVIQPGIERVTDPKFVDGVKGYASEAGRRAGDLGKNANDWSKSQFGVDVAGQVGGLVSSVRGRPQYAGYDAIGHQEEETSALYHDAADDDFFAQQERGAWQQDSTAHDGHAQSTTTASTAAASKTDDWDEWKEF